MEHIKKIKAIKTFEELLKLRDEYDKIIADYKGDILSDDYENHLTNCKYRNMTEDRIKYLIKNGAKIDQITIDNN